MALTHRQVSPFTWEELGEILEESPATPHARFAKAVNAIASANEDGYISEEEAEILFRWVAAQYIAPPIDKISHSIMAWDPFRGYPNRSRYPDRDMTRRPVHAW